METLKRILTAGLLVWALGAQAADSDALKQLVDQAEFWDTRGRTDLSKAAWQRVFQLDGQNVHALERLYAIAVAEDDSKAAADYRATLINLKPDSPLLSHPDGAKQRQQTLEQARRLAANGKSDEAVKLFESTFTGTPPKELALEYYETLAGSSGGWQRARSALEQLHKANPENARYALAYARVLTYRTQTRRMGIELLEGLNRQKSIATDAQAAWRQALLWLDAGTGDRSYYQRYLQAVGSDTAVAKKLNEIDAIQRGRQLAAAATRRGAVVRDAYTALEGGDIQVAESRFREMLKANAQDADASAGLGLIALQRKQFDEAAGLLQRAVDLKPALSKNLNEALRTAKFWAAVAQARSEREQQMQEAALTSYATALNYIGAKRADASVVAEFSSLLIEVKKTSAAEKLLREAMLERPDDSRLRLALARVLIDTGRMSEADQIISKLDQDADQQDGTYSERRDLRIEVLRTQAARAQASGSAETAEKLLSEALALDPSNGWVRLELSRELRSRGRGEDADELLNVLTETSQSTADASKARVLALNESGQLYEALLAMESVAPADRDADLRRLQKQVWIRYQLQRATQAAKFGDTAQALDLLEQANSVMAGDPRYATDQADVWRALGDPARAIASLRQARKGREPTTDESMVYVGLLLELGQNAEFDAVAEQMLRDGKLSTEQQAQLEDLIVGYRIRLSDSLRQQGDLAGAYRQLREVALRYPTQVRVQMALLRLFNSSGDHAQALELARSLIDYTGDQTETRLAAVDAALAAQEADQAERWLAPLLQEHADDPAVLRAAARLADFRGRSAESLSLLSKAVGIERQLAEEARFPSLTLLDPITHRPIALPELVHGMLRGPDQPVGPLLPRAGDNGPYLGVNGFVGANDSFSTQVTRLPAAKSGSALKTKPGLALTLDPRLVGASTASSVSEEDALEEQLQRLRTNISPWVDGSFVVRGRAGESGLSRLAALEVPMDFVSTEWNAGRVALRVKPVLLDAGVVSGQNKLLFGSLALINGETDNLEQSASGIALTASYKLGSFGIVLGTTPLGFPEENMVGAIRWTPTLSETVRLSTEFSRSAVTDSLLAYAGAYDLLTGRNWGGVLRTGGRMDLAYDLASHGVYVNGGYYGYGGHNVEENTEYELGGGLFFRLLKSARSNLTLGVNLTSFRYERNLRYFTFGHGGYFSPQFFSALTAPLNWSGNLGRLSYRTNLAIGIQTFREDGAPLYPGFASLQDELEKLAEFEPTADIPLGYPAQNIFGLGYRLGGDLQYLVTPHLSVGGRLSLDNARDYEESIAQVFVIYRFNGRNDAIPHFDLQVPGLGSGALQ